MEDDVDLSSTKQENKKHRRAVVEITERACGVDGAYFCNYKVQQTVV